MKKWIHKAAQRFVVFIHQEHREEQVRISKGSEALSNGVVKSRKTSTPEAKIEHLARDKCPSQLLVETFLLHGRPADPNASISGAL